MKQYKFEEREIPYDKLEQLGLTQEMIEDLPLDVLQDIYDGRPSPLLPVRLSMVDGGAVTCRSRFALVRGEDGKVDFMFYPALEEYELSQFNDADKAKLMEGKTILGFANKEHEAQGLKSYIQLDPDTKQVTSVPATMINRNVQLISDNLRLVETEKQSLQNGKVLTIMTEKQQISLGIDLNSRSGIRFAAGDDQTWEREQKRDWDKYTFGAFGCWVMDDDGNLDYVNDEDFTEEMWNEQKNARPHRGY